MAAQPQPLISDTMVKINQLLGIFDDDVKDGQTQTKKKAPPPPPPSVTFNFVGIRPTKSHLQNNQTSKMVLDTCSTKIIFNNLSLNDPISKLKELIQKEFEIPIKRSLLIMYGHIKLIKDNLLLKDYGITNNSWFIIAIYDNIKTNHEDTLIDHNYASMDDADDDQKLQSISRNAREANRRQRDMNAVRRRLQRIREMRTGIKAPIIVGKKRKIKHINTLKKALNNLKIDTVCGLDIITMEKDVNCMKLPSCGHILSQNSLYQYTLAQFKDRHQILKCPHMHSTSNKLCNKKWDYPVIKQYLLSNNTNNKLFEYSILELLSARNVIEIDYELQKCIKCQTLLYRNKKDNNFNCETVCPLCTNISFCWGCNNEWTDDHVCDTTFKAQTMDIISSCLAKTVGKVQNVPSIRSCPKCNQLIHHVAACKHMKCSFCKTSFCFVCLKIKENNKWQCGYSDTVCPIAKRQNYKLLPKLNQTSFELFS